jgi:ADP-heptose:LPS heptosyltransferase/polysaccharide pyruvyl transferase WcaK-like protein
MTALRGRRIVVLNPDSMGELVLRQPLFAGIAAQAASLVLVVRPGLIPLAERLAPDATLVPLPPDPYDAVGEPDPLHVAQVVTELRTLDVDTVVVGAYQRTRFDELVVEALPETVRIGFTGDRYPANTPAAQPPGWAERLTQAVTVSEREHDWLKNRRLAAATFGDQRDWPRPHLTAMPRELDAAARLLTEQGVDWPSFHVACVGASDRVAARSWPADRWGSVIDHAIRRHGWRFLLIGTPDEREGNACIMRQLAFDGQGGAGAAWLDTTIEFDALIGLLSRAAGYLGRDSGPMHLAAALGKPVISVTGGGTWPRFVPLAPAGASFCIDVPCAGCGWFCHLDESFCVTQVPIEPVLEAVDALATNRLTNVVARALPRNDSLAAHMEREAARNGRSRTWELHRVAAQLERAAPAPRETHRSTRPRVFLGMPFYGAGNIGDDLALAGFLEAWRRLGSPAELSAAIPFPLAPQARRFPDIEWHADAPHVREAAIRDCDIWLALGGSPFQTDTGPWMLDHLARDTVLCRRHDRAMYFLGVGLNDRAALTDPRARDVLANAAHLWIRDADCAAWMAAVAGSERVTAAADLAHVFLEKLPTRSLDPHRLGWALVFEDESQCATKAIEQVVARLSDWTHDWLVQDVRLLPGGERWWHRRLDTAARRSTHLRLPDYAAATTAELLAAWPSGEAVVSSRYHALLLGAWRGSRLVAVTRSEKLAAAATSLGCTVIDRADDAPTMCAAIAAAKPVARGRLSGLAALAFDACRALADRLPRAGTLALSAPTSSVVEFGPRLDGGGWHEPERDAVSWFRWLGGAASAWVDVPVPASGAARLRCDVGHVAAAGIAEGVQLRLDGAPLVASLRGGDHGWTIEADLPLLATGSVVRIEFIARDAIRPRDLDAANAETRRLAIAVRRLWLEPASAQE